MAPPKLNFRVLQRDTSPSRSANNMIDAHCAATNEKSIFIFLIMVDLVYIVYFHVCQCHRHKKEISYKIGHISMKDAQCAKTIEKSIFPFLRYGRFCTEISL